MASNRGKNLAKRRGKTRFWLQDRKSVNDVDGWGKHGGYMNAKKKKLNDQFQSVAFSELQKTSHCSDIFKDVTIYINGYTKPSSDELKRLMMIHGGHWEMYLSKKNVTHIITTNLAQSKIAALRNYKVVHPDWILKSIEAERLLPCQPFLLYSAQSKMQRGIAQFSTSLPKAEASKEGPTHLEASRDFHLTETSTPSSNNNNTEVKERSGPPELKIVHSGSSDDLFFSSSDNLSQESNQETKCKTNISTKNEVLTEAVSLSAVTKATSMTTTTTTTTTVTPSEECPTLIVVSSDSEKEDEIVVTDHVKKVDTLPPNNNNNDSSINTTTTLSTNTGVQHTGSSRAQTARDPNYLQQFYTNSRLHHLSTWKAEWKDYVNKLKSSNTKEFPGRQKLKDVCSKVQSPSLTDSIMHIDMDSFFVAVAMRDRPHLKDKPVAVTHSRKKGPKENNPGVDLDYERQQWSKRRQENALKKMGPNTCQRNTLALDEEFEDEEEGSEAEEKDEDLENTSNEKRHSVNKQSFNSLSEIASCNYVARQFGLKNGMFVGDALKLCPDIITIPYEFDKYQAVSKILYDTVASYTHDIEAISCDEMFVDCRGILQETGVALKDFISVLRQEIFDKTGCTASAGLGPNILVARLATIRAKPNGQFLVEKREVEAFMQKQLVKSLPGVGRSMMYKLQHLSVETCEDLQKIPLVKLQQSFGQKTGQMLYNSCRGIDNRRLELEHNRKSVSAEINYGIRFTKESDMEDFLLNLSGEVERRLKNVNKRGKSITLKLMVRREDAPLETAKYMGHGLCNNISRAMSVAIATDNAARIARECMTLFKALHLPVNSLRGVGITIQRLEDTAPARHHTGDSTKTSSILQFTKAMPTPNQKEEEEQQQQQTQNGNETQSEVDDSDFAVMRPVPVKQFGTLNFKEELLRQYHSSQLPPLPRLPSQLSPTRTNQMKPAVTGEPEDFLPSPSQVDENVLKELPDDICNQIKTALEEKKAKRKTSAAYGSSSSSSGGGGGALAHDEQPGCSYWSETTISDENGQGADSMEEPVKENQNLSQIERELLPNLSQLDESCFNALPEDIQEEMKMAITDRQNRKNNMEADDQLELPLLLSPSKGGTMKKSPTKKSPTKKSTKPTKKRSPSKKGSPSKKRSPAKRSPNFKVPQGRPKKIQKSLNNLLNIRKNLFLYGDHLHLQTKTEVREAEGEKTEKELKEAKEREKHFQAASLCGAVTIEQVRSLLSEWLQPSRAPCPDDEQFVIKYLKDLIYSKNLEQLDLVLKFLYRKMGKLSTEDWWKSLKRVVDDVQCVMIAEYNTPLQLSFSIPVT
ncbi:DNA repair protein REV1-like isoform X1 [Octopus sinensis]|uniref:DNA repair protein REV1 n=1 Tax=Octopus sinensis TaxID=2607531 RepID=A0A6P7TII6_9MOLL|nr:DNA repair protein REV1-like isoform X1 [Octopus sinensis]